MKHSRTPRMCRWLIGSALVLVVMIFVVPWALSPLATSALNRKLATLHGYRAHVDSVRIALWRSAVDLEGFSLIDRAHEPDGPLVKIAHGSMTLLPFALVRGKFSGHGSISDSELFIIQDQPAPGEDSKEAKLRKAKERAANAREWQKQLQERFAIEISRFEITRTKIRFVDRSLAPRPELTIEDFELRLTGLKTTADAGNPLPAKIEVRARFPGGGTLRVHASLAPLEHPPRFKTTMEIKDLALPPLHDFFLAYANVDVKKGSFEVFVEAEALNGHYNGYVKPFLHDLEFNAVPDPEKNFVQQTATKVASAVTNLLKNDEQNVATKAPFRGDFDNNEVDIWTTLENLLRNAFVQSIREGFEGQKPTG